MTRSKISCVTPKDWKEFTDAVAGRKLKVRVNDDYGSPVAVVAVSEDAFQSMIWFYDIKTFEVDFTADHSVYISSFKK